MNALSPAVATLAELFASGRAIDWILVLMAVEAVTLLLYRARTGRGVAPLPLLANLAAGACLLLALRAALTGSAPILMWLLLGVALVAHLLDLLLRLPGRRDL